MSKYNVAVTGLNATDNPAPGIPVIRSIRSDKSFKGKIIGLAYDALDTGIYDSDLIDEVYLIPYPQEGEGNLLERIRYITTRTSINVLIPTLDSELINICRLENDFKDLNINMLVPSQSQLKLRSKVSLYEFCKKEKFDTPKTVVINDPAQLKECLKEIGLPLVVKALFYGAHICHSLEEAHVNFQRLRAQWGLPIVVQKLVLGEEYDVVSLGSRAGKCVGAVAMRKLGITEKGKAWAGITIRDEKLMTLSENILKRLKWTGPIELEFVKEYTTKEYFLIEINPRFPSWCYLAQAAGQNLPLATALIAMGKKIKPFTNYKTGVTFVRHAVDLVCPIKYLEELSIKGELIYNEWKTE